MAKIFAVTNQKGGVGKTTTAVNLAGGLAHCGKRVLLCDIDPQGNATTGLGVFKSTLKYSTYDIMLSNVSTGDCIISTSVTNLDLLPSSLDLAGAEIELISTMSRETVLKRSLDKVRANYDYIIIDCPPSLGLITLNGLTACDKVIVPIQCEFYALEGLSQLMYTINMVRKNLNSTIDIEGVVLTMYDKRNNLSGQVAAEVKKHFPTKLFNTLIPRNIRLSEAPSFGLTIQQYSPESTGAMAYNSLAAEIISKER
ncbi:MAG: ParA family protein [Clostridiales bacterium]|nr:ParA family protein [Clostridiales bacterium]